jgi:hypothetical protein
VNIDTGEDFVWQRLALCNGMVRPRDKDGNVYDPLFDGYENSVEEARATDEMCSRCPVRANCLRAGVQGREQGVWGGVYLKKGRIDPDRNEHKTPEQLQEVRDLLNDIANTGP